MIWLGLAVLVAITYAAQGLCSKKLLETQPEPRVNGMLFAVATPPLAIYLAVRGLPRVDAGFWPVLAISAAGGLLSFYLFMRALRLTDLSIAYPLISLTPLVMVPAEFVLIGDLPRPLGLAGVTAIVAGVYVLNLSRGMGSALDPLRAVLRDRGARYALALAAVWALTGVIDKIAIRHSSPAFYAPMLTASLTVLFAPLALRARRRPAAAEARTARGADLGPDHRTDRPADRRAVTIALFVLQGLFFAAMAIAQYEAIRMTLVSYVIAIKRTGTLLGVLFGYLFLSEREIGFRLAGAAVIVAGIFLLAFG